MCSAEDHENSMVGLKSFFFNALFQWAVSQNSEAFSDYTSLDLLTLVPFLVLIKSLLYLSTKKEN